MDLNTVWFILFFVLIGGYAVLDGFDLGVGVLHLFTRSPQERQMNMQAIGPFWDGNEVWLLTGGGALFAAFPVVYATVFSSFYLALMLVLFALIFRAVSLEFSHQVDHPLWRGVWDWAFGLGSLLAALLFGVAVGNILRGLPINSKGVFTGSFVGLLNPFALLAGLLSLFMCSLHGAVWLCVKTEGAQQRRSRKWVGGLWMAVVALFCVVTVMTFMTMGHLTAGVFTRPLTWCFLLLLAAGLLLLPLTKRRERDGWMFICSSAVILSMIGLGAVSLFPRLVPSLTDAANSLTIYNASSTVRTQTVMLWIAIIGMPLVLIYTAVIYRVFRGKVAEVEEGY